MPWSVLEVLSLASDPPSAHAGSALAVASKWSNLGTDERSIWGEAQGSGSKPYQTAIDLCELAFKCSCPSRKFPCKHGLGLFLLYAQSKIGPGTPPEWVAEWLTKREAKIERKTASENVPNPEAKAKRIAKREDRIVEGVADCETWLKDLVRGGLSNPTLIAPKHFEAMAARLIDAQAPGFARSVRKMSGTAACGSGWQSQLLQECGALYLLLKAYQKLDSLSEPLRDEVRQAAGWTFSREEISQLPPEVDRWTVVGQAVSVEEKITVTRSWLYGASTHRCALYLSFVGPGMIPERVLAVGQSFEGLLAFYPGVSRLRAQIVDVWGCTPPTLQYRSVEDNLNAYATFLTNTPWNETFPMALSGCQLGPHGHSSTLIQDGVSLPINHHFQSWQLLSLTGNQPASVFGEWNGAQFTPMSVLMEGTPYPL